MTEDVQEVIGIKLVINNAPNIVMIIVAIELLENVTAKDSLKTLFRSGFDQFNN